MSFNFSKFSGSPRASFTSSNFSLIDPGLSISTPNKSPALSIIFTLAPSIRSPVFSITGPTTGISAISGNSTLFCSSIFLNISLASFSLFVCSATSISPPYILLCFVVEWFLCKPLNFFLLIIFFVFLTIAYNMPIFYFVLLSSFS